MLFLLTQSLFFEEFYIFLYKFSVFAMVSIIHYTQSYIPERKYKVNIFIKLKEYEIIQEIIICKIQEKIKYKES